MVYQCSHCDAQFPKWSGRCSECGKWGTLKEALNTKSEIRNPVKIVKGSAPAKVASLQELSFGSLKRIALDAFPASVIVPKGLVMGSITLLAGEPGAGKSTLALQLAQNYCTNTKVLYISAEESASQLKERADRLGTFSTSFMIAESTRLEEIVGTIEAHKPQVVVIDSIQTIVSDQSTGELGSVNQVRVVTASLSQLAKSAQVAIILIGHVTKDGGLAGPKSLEHLVDAVYYLESDKHSAYRLLRCFKNRYGDANTVTVMQLASSGLKEVRDAATIFVQNYAAKPGSVITVTSVENQIFFVEVQALVTKSSFGYAKRTASGFSRSRLELLLAIMKKHLHVDCDAVDVFINVAGGFKVHEPAMDLAVLISILSSLKEESLPAKTVVFGEVGLSGELRSVRETAQRLLAAEKHAFTAVIVPPLPNSIASKLKINACTSIADVVKLLKW
jgi:DNA repair protein RadA/Sms